jgi:hypothetical protein
LGETPGLEECSTQTIESISERTYLILPQAVNNNEANRIVVGPAHSVARAFFVIYD